MELFTKAAEQGDAQGQCSLGFRYHEGQAWPGRGPAQDLGKAFEWYTKAAEQGHANGQCHVGLCYKEGQGVAQDCGKALEWFIKALEQPQDEADWRHPEKLARAGRNCTRDRGEMAVYVRSWITQQHAKQTSAELALVATTIAWRAVGWLWVAESARCLHRKRTRAAVGRRKDIVTKDIVRISLRRV